MAKRKISEAINVRINVGNYQHIELSKYAEEEIEYSNQQERIQKEDELRDELVSSLIRSMKAIPEKLGKGIEEAIQVEEAIQKAIPEWLEKGATPNIAKKKHIQDTAEQKNQLDAAKENLSEVLEESPSATSDDDLFEEDKMPEPALTTEEATEEKVEPEKEEKKEPVTAGDDEDFFDDDLF